MLLLLFFFVVIIFIQCDKQQDHYITLVNLDLEQEEQQQQQQPHSQSSKLGNWLRTREKVVTLIQQCDFIDTIFYLNGTNSKFCSKTNVLLFHFWNMEDHLIVKEERIQDHFSLWYIDHHLQKPNLYLHLPRCIFFSVHMNMNLTHEENKTHTQIKLEIEFEFQLIQWIQISPRVVEWIVWHVPKTCLCQVQIYSIISLVKEDYIYVEERTGMIYHFQHKKNIWFQWDLRKSTVVQVRPLNNITTNINRNHSTE